MSCKANTHSTGVASELLVCSMLLRMGVEAHLTWGNHKSMDIRVVYNNTAWSIDVKAVRGYSSWVVNNAAQQSDHWLVLLSYNDKFQDANTMPDVYVLPSLELKHIAKSFKDQLRVFKVDVAKYHNAWRLMFDAYGIQ